MRNSGGVQGAENAPTILFLSKKFFWGGGDYCVEEGQIKKQNYFLTHYLGCVKKK
jgi:hypothetical protein